MSWGEEQQRGYGYGQGYGGQPGTDPYGYGSYPYEPSYPHQPSYAPQAEYAPYATAPETAAGPVADTAEFEAPSAVAEAEPVAEPEPEAPVAPGPPSPPKRDRYFDSLRAAALIRVVTYHTFGWAWCGMVFPSMGIMFALAGTLMARSLQRPALTVIRSRVRRLLPPFWFWGVFVVLAMLIHDWMPGWQIVYWVVPLGDPPGNAWGEQAWEILWYLRTYLWFVLLSPVLLRLFRRAPLPVLFLSLVPVVVFQFAWDPGDDRFGTALWDLATYLFCWILGFAHRDGVLERLKPAAVAFFSLAAVGYGGWYAFSHQADAGGTYDLDEIPLAQAFWSAGYVLLLMWAKARFRIDFAGLTRYRRLDRIVTVFNARAVTVYLWHEIALILAVPLIDQFWNVPAFEKYLPLESQWFMFGIGWLLIAACVLVCGWVEDVAARKRPRLLPG
jgi:peptidoglycan/LPS O-acetylase OafA/YrhL